jgi:branched-chain amino acid transport system substrate-binding protein
VLAVVALAAVACSSSKKTASTGNTGTTSGGASGGTIKLGFFGELTGPDAQLGINAYDGEKLAIDQYNQTNPANKIELIKYDDQGDSGQAPQLAQKVISDKTVAVVGPLFSGISKVTDPILEQAGIVYITASATAVVLASHGWKYFYRAVGNDASQGPAAAKYISQKLKAKNVAVVDDNEEYSLGIADIVRSSIKSNGGNVVFSDHIDKAAQDYSATVNRLKAANPDAIFYGGYYSEGGRFIKQLHDAGVTAKVVTDDGANDDKLISTAGPAAAEGVTITCPCGDITKDPKGASFTSAYTSAFGMAPATYSAEAYDAANALLQAIKAGNKTSASINTYMKTIDYPGLTKTLKFDDKGEVISPTIYLYQVQGGKRGFLGSVDSVVAS